MSDLYDATIPAFSRGLENLRSWFARAESHADGAGIDRQELIDARLAADMLPFSQQVGYAYFTSLEASQHLSGKTPPEMTYDEKSFDELRTSIDRVVAYLGSIAASDLTGVEGKEVETFLLPDRRIPVAIYVREYALPNFYFHIVTAYDILRHKGIALGKADYIGGSPVG